MRVEMLPWILLTLAPSLAPAAQETAVVVKPVEELTVRQPIVVNGEIRARHDIVLPATVDGRLEWVLEEGTQIRKGETVAKVDDKQLHLQKKEQTLLADRASVSLRYLQGEVDRLTHLTASNLASQTQLADMVSRRDIAANDVAVARVRVAELEDTLSRTEIRSPIGGVVIARLHHGGEYARTGEGVLRVIDPASLEVVVNVPLSHYDLIKTGQAVDVSITDVAFTSRLKAVMSAGDRASQTFRGLVDVPEKYARLLAAGQFAEVTIPLSAGQKALFVPRDAVVLRSEGNFVYRIDDHNKARRVPVMLGAGQGDMVAVTGNLSPGDNVAVRGVERLADGQGVVPVNG